jgi:hypothetical protein
MAKNTYINSGNVSVPIVLIAAIGVTHNDAAQHSQTLYGTFAYVLGMKVVPDGDGGVGVEKRMTFDLSFDHRVVDGADAARFLGTLAGHIDEAEKYAE